MGMNPLPAMTMSLLCAATFAHGDLSFSDHDEYLIDTSGGAYTYTRCVASGDLNNDGTEDVVVTDRYNENIVLYLNDGTGQLTEIDSINATEQNRIVVIVDVNNDGLPDICTACKNGANVFINLGSDPNGSPRFRYPVRLDAGVNPHWIEHADLDNDGFQDLLVADFGTPDAAGGWHAFINEGDGTFGDGIVFDWGTDARCISIACGDLDHDGFDDIAVLGRYTQLAVYTNQGIDSSSGQWNGAVNTSNYKLMGIEACSIRMADFQQDGSSDIVLAHRTNSFTTLLSNDGSGGFNLRLIYTLPSELAQPIDINRDGAVDLLLAHKHHGSFSAMINDGDGNFTLEFQSDAIFSIDTKFLTCSDLDQDDDPDVILVDAYPDEDKGAIRIFFNETPCNAMSLNADCNVDIQDLLLLIGNWGDCGGDPACKADFDQDGTVDVIDLLALISSWDS